MKILFIYNIFLTSLCFSLNLEHSDIYDNSWALVVGINKYENVKPLHYAIEDAIAVLILVDCPGVNIFLQLEA